MVLAKAPTVFVSGASRGIGLAVALKLAKAGANVTIAAKTATPHPKLPGTIYTAAEEVEKAGGKALPLVLDIRSADAVQDAIEQTASKFGGIDIVINNASAISLTKSTETSVKTYDLMNSINSRGTFLVSKFTVPHLLASASKGRNPHILTYTPPLEGNLTPEALGPATAYAMAKIGMSLATLGLAGELQGKVGVNALWPLTYISTEAIRLISGEQGRQKSRDPSIMAEASFGMLSKDGTRYTGNFEIDEIFLRRELGYDSQKLSTFGLVKFDELHEDLYIPQWVRDKVRQLRESDSSTRGT
ncbi:NAD(P)-binding protein [Meredithblackwellia eburnea MCA 4105]